MKQDLDRVKNDLEAIQRAMGLPVSPGREWIHWMKRDRWHSLWWCLPGAILMAGAWMPADNVNKYLGLRPVQWMGLLAAAALLGIAIVLSRKAAGKDGRPESMIRETRIAYGMNSQGLQFAMVCAVQLFVYFAWGNYYHIAFKPFWTGLFCLMGFTCLVGALAARAWLLLGYAIPFLAYGLCQPLVENHKRLGGTLLGLMFVAIAMSFSIIQVWQIRQVERLHDSD